ncbi:MAG TPA: hypothetical protein VMU99_10905 [Acidimicrobiales bacterium]|nr:hypothetical protein [Acidimicrobiales bacterium]
MSEEEFAFRYGILRPLLTLIGLGSRQARVVFHERVLEVRFGYGFRAEIPFSAIYNAKPEPGMISGVGVHGWRGNWLVNGSAWGLVGFDLDQKVDAQVLGFPVKLLHLRMSLERPGNFLARLAQEVPLSPRRG